MIRGWGVRCILVGLALAFVAACSESGDDVPAPVSTSPTSTTVAESVELAADVAQDAIEGVGDDGLVDRRTPETEGSLEISSFDNDHDETRTVIPRPETEISPVAPHPGVVGTEPFIDLVLSGTYGPLPPPTPSGPVVYLTLDDGPHPTYTPLMLDVLARHGARATFFVLGSLVERYPDMIGRIIDEGHTLANHTWNHENLGLLSREAFDKTVSRTQDALGDLATPCLRPPYGGTNSSTREWAAAHGLEVIMWTASANDWLDLDAEAIADRIVDGITDGAIILMHDGGGNRSRTVQGLEIALDRLSDRDLLYEPLCV